MAEEQQTTQTTAPAKVEIELDDKGAPKELPEPLQRELDRRVNAAVQTALKNVEKKSGLSPAEREELAAVKQKLSLAEQAAAEHNQQWKEALRIQEERLEAKRAAELAAEKEALKARDARIARYQQQTALSTIRTAAVAAGARDESLTDLEELLGPKVAFDPETDEPYIPGADGSKQPVKDFVSGYLQARPHFLGRPKGTPGRATGGMALAGRTVTPQDMQRASVLDAAKANPSARNLDAVVATVIRKRAS